MASFQDKIRLVVRMPWLAVGFLLAAGGCQSLGYSTHLLDPSLPMELQSPHERAMVSLPSYRIEPPDILQIEVRKLVPRPPYRIQIYDVLTIQASGTLPEQPIYNLYIVQGEGEVDLGPVYGRVRVGGLSIEEAQEAVIAQLTKILTKPSVSIKLSRTAGTQEISGTYIVRADGSVNLRGYGAVPLAGKTLAEAQIAVEELLAQFFDTPEVTINVVGYNSKTYFVIRENAALGDEVIRIPVSGNETVLDAVGKIGGLSRATSTRMWIARPVPGAQGCEQILAVDYLAVSRGGQTTTNYQLMPGDRLYIAEDGLVAVSGLINQFTNPMYRLLSVSQLGAYTVRGFQTTGRAYNFNTRF
jgi:polysaccharide biosynthesis/export protein